MKGTEVVLSKSKLVKLLVDIAAVDDLPILNDDRNLPSEICEPIDRQTVREMAMLVAEVLQGFDYLRSPEFEESVAGKSAALAAMKQRLASDPVKRVELRRRLESALGDVLASDDAFKLVSREQHTAIRNLIELAGRLRNPAE